ncbi:MAG: NHL repeat-containing protein [Candidatus Latescibacterota bacterium]|nr:MAG: NHL repeat-containing protein [Candidatus Latescibacterota bacterium]
MISSHVFISTSLLILCALNGCASQGIELDPPGADEPEAVFTTFGGITLGDPLAVTIGFSDNVFVADGLPGRVVCWVEPSGESLEFQKPTQQPGFYPSDVKLSGFFVYALDPVERTLLRFDNRGAYRDILIRFDAVVPGQRITPIGLDVDDSGRIAVTDVKNHQVILFDSYLSIELVFGSYGSSQGQFDAPEGITFTSDGNLLVTDSGNKRVQLFDSGGTYLRSIPTTQDNNPMAKPRRAVIDNKGNVFVADPAAGRVFVFDEEGVFIRSITPKGVSRFEPTDVEVTRSGRVYVTDAANSSLFVFR